MKNLDRQKVLNAEPCTGIVRCSHCRKTFTDYQSLGDKSGNPFGIGGDAGITFNRIFKGDKQIRYQIPFIVPEILCQECFDKLLDQIQDFFKLPILRQYTHVTETQHQFPDPCELYT